MLVSRGSSGLILRAVAWPSVLSDKSRNSVIPPPIRAPVAAPPGPKNPPTVAPAVSPTPSPPVVCLTKSDNQDI